MGYIINNFAAPTSIKGIRDYLVNVEGLAITEDTVARYIRILENAKIISRCSRFDMKSRKSLAGEQKYYLACCRAFHLLMLARIATLGTSSNTQFSVPGYVGHRRESLSCTSISSATRRH